MATHLEQRHRGVVSSLIRAGIGKYYHDRSLSEFPVAAKQVEWIASGAAKDEIMKSGAGITVVGPGRASYDVAMLLARGLHLKGVASKVLPLRRLVKWLELRDGYDALAEANEATALFVTDFMQSYNTGECPLTQWQIQDVETFLGERLDSRKAVFLHADMRLEARKWWSKPFVQRVASTNTLLEVEK